MDKYGLLENEDVESILSEANEDIKVTSEEASSVTVGLAWGVAALTPGAAAGFCW